jgi:hypothetical protein
MEVRQFFQAAGKEEQALGYVIPAAKKSCIIPDTFMDIMPAVILLRIDCGAMTVWKNGFKNIKIMALQAKAGILRLPMLAALMRMHKQRDKVIDYVQKLGIISKILSCPFSYYFASFRHFVLSALIGHKKGYHGVMCFICRLCHGGQLLLFTSSLQGRGYRQVIR